MRVTVALEEAKVAQGLLSDLEGGWLDELKDVLALMQNIHGQIPDAGLRRVINDDIVKRLSRISTSGSEKTARLSAIHSFHAPLSNDFINLSNVALELLMSSRNIHDNVMIDLRNTTLDGVNEAIEHIQNFDIAKAGADACVRAWLAFAEDSDDTIHQLTMNFVGQESLGIATVIASLELLDIWFIVAAADKGDSDIVNKITIERIESGSVVAWFKNVPDEVWNKIIELWRRIINPELTRIENAVAAADMLRIVGETAAQINQMKESSALTPELAKVLLEKLHSLPERGLPNETQVLVTEVDGESLANFPLAQLPPPGNDTGEAAAAESDADGDGSASDAV